MKTKVTFRKDEGGITAVLPDVESNYGHCVCYAHVGQHNECTRGWYHTTRPAKPEEYADLLAGLTGIYGPLQVARRLPGDAWRKV